MGKTISSLQNPLIKKLLALQQKPRERRLMEECVIEGEREIRMAQQAGFRFRQLLFCREVIPDGVLPEWVSGVSAECEVIEVPESVFEKLAYRESAGGVIAVVETQKTLLSEIDPGSDPLILVLESVEKPGNLGAVFRTADAAGVTAILVCEPSTDIFNPNVIRASLGTVFTNRIATCTTTDAISWLKKNGIRSYAAALTGQTLYQEADYRQPSAIVMGSEAEGLSEAWLQQSDLLIRIPMRGKVDSLNVSTSAAILLFEAVRQRLA